MSNVERGPDVPSSQMHISGGFHLSIWSQETSIYETAVGLRLTEDELCFFATGELAEGETVAVRIGMPGERGQARTELELKVALTQGLRMEDGRLLCRGLFAALPARSREALRQFIAAQVRRVAGCLAEFPMLAALGPAELEELAQSVTPLRLGRREILYREGGEEPERAGVYVVHRGTVKVFKGRDPDEPKRTLAVLGPGEIFSEMSLIEPGPHRASIITLVAAEVLLINTLGFETMKQRHPGTALKFMEMIARVLVKRLTRTTTKLFSPVRL